MSAPGPLPQDRSSLTAIIAWSHCVRRTPSGLDDFEGPGYRRVVATVHTAGRDVAACIYVLVED